MEKQCFARLSHAARKQTRRTMAHAIDRGTVRPAHYGLSYGMGRLAALCSQYPQS